METHTQHSIRCHDVTSLSCFTWFFLVCCTTNCKYGIVWLNSRHRARWLHGCTPSNWNFIDFLVQRPNGRVASMSAAKCVAKISSTRYNATCTKVTVATTAAATTPDRRLINVCLCDVTKAREQTFFIFRTVQRTLFVRAAKLCKIETVHRQTFTTFPISHENQTDRALAIAALTLVAF